MASADVVPFPNPTANRLASALSRLVLAQEGQKEALAELRSTLAELRREATRLEASVREWDGQVGRLAQQNAAAKEAARVLCLNAERM